MLKRILQSFAFLFMVACSDTDSDNTTELITDSYFFQKNVFNVNLYNCRSPQNNFNSFYKKTDNQINFINVSEIKEMDVKVSDCNLLFIQVNELTPIKRKILEGNFYLEISSCIANNDEKNTNEALNPYLEYLKSNDINIWSGISTFDENSFYWLNIWPNEPYREEFLKNWLNSSDSGFYSSQLKNVASCSNPETYNFTS